jgi:hypothetical protein
MGKSELKVNLIEYGKPKGLNRCRPPLAVTRGAPLHPASSLPQGYGERARKSLGQPREGGQSPPMANRGCHYIHPAPLHQEKGGEGGTNTDRVPDDPGQGAWPPPAATSFKEMGERDQSGGANPRRGPNPSPRPPVPCTGWGNPERGGICSTAYGVMNGIFGLSPKMTYLVCMLSSVSVCVSVPMFVLLHIPRCTIRCFFVSVFFKCNFTACVSYLMWNRVPCSHSYM